MYTPIFKYNGQISDKKYTKREYQVSVKKQTWYKKKHMCALDKNDIILRANFDSQFKKKTRCI